MKYYLPVVLVGSLVGGCQSSPQGQAPLSRDLPFRQVEMTGVFEYGPGSDNLLAPTQGVGNVRLHLTLHKSNEKVLALISLNNGKARTVWVPPLNALDYQLAAKHSHSPVIPLPPIDLPKLSDSEFVAIPPGHALSGVFSFPVKYFQKGEEYKVFYSPQIASKGDRVTRDELDSQFVRFAH